MIIRCYRGQQGPLAAAPPAHLIPLALAARPDELGIPVTDTQDTETPTIQT